MKKKAFIILSVALVIFLFYSIFTHEKAPNKIESYRFDFNEMDKEFWLVGEWETFRRSYDLVTMEDGILKLSADTTGVMPYMLSKPIELQSKDVLTIKRKVKISHGSGTFAGGFSLYQTADLDIEPGETDGSWFTAIGDGIVLVEYSYDLDNVSVRPGKDVFRFLASDWEYNDNYQMVNPIYDEWVEETLIFDMRSNQMSYRINDKEYKLYSYPLDKNAIRIMMHPYGTGVGNSIEIDYIEVTIEDKSSKR